MAMLKIGVPVLAEGKRVTDIMTTQVTFLDTMQTVDDAWAVLHAKSISGAPVLDARGRLVGIASKADLADPRGRDVGEAAGVTRTVKDVMTRVVYAVRADDAVVNAVRLMIAEDIHRALVVTDEGSVVGIVTPMDVLRALVHGSEFAGGAGSVPVKFVDLRELK
jgi:predicted transcriptional regulator